MKRHFLLPLLAVAGVLVAVLVVIRDNRSVIVQTPSVQAPSSPYPSFITGTGIVEAALGNVVIGSPVTGVVTDIYVQVGDHVAAVQPLFKIDDRILQAQLVSARAKVKEAGAALRLPRHRLEFSEQLAKRDPGAISEQTLTELQDALNYASSSLELAKAQAQQLETEVNLHTIRAPSAGRILKMTMRLGEFVDSASAATPLLIFGQDERLFVRTNIDETEGWRLEPGAEATALVRGNPELQIPLRYEYTEPYIMPKTALTGQATERTDWRVLQVIYSFEPGEFPVYVGQQLDVYMPAQPLFLEHEVKGGRGPST